MDSNDTKHSVIDYERHRPAPKTHPVETIEVWVIVVLCGGVALIAIVGAAAIGFAVLFGVR